jgi:UDP-N-acetylmuramate: L-alanyl-gamma-D-glutamyl-meso-diaminopimelate ligase
MEVVAEKDGKIVIDDFAHHPTAVQTTLEGARKRYEGRPLWALFEPRSASSCRKVFQNDYAKSLGVADQVLLAPVGRNLDPAIALNTHELARDIGPRALACDSIDEVVSFVYEHAPPGVVLLCMSNGSFGGIHHKLL